MIPPASFHIFFFVNVLFMMVSILVGFMLFVAPTCCAGMVKLCCKACGGKTNAMKRVKQCARGYLVLALYILCVLASPTPPLPPNPPSPTPALVLSP